MTDADKRMALVIHGLDDMLGSYIPNYANHTKIITTLDWLSSNCSQPELLAFMQSLELEHFDTIKDLLENPYFNKDLAS